MRGKASGNQTTSVFFLQNGETRIQYKIFSRDLLWLPEAGYTVLHSVPQVRTKPVFAPVLDADVRELQALDKFIKMKEQQIARHTTSGDEQGCYY